MLWVSSRVVVRRAVDGGAEETAVWRSEDGTSVREKERGWVATGGARGFNLHAVLGQPYNLKMKGYTMLVGGL